MNKGELVAQVAAKSGKSKEEVRKSLESILDVMQEEMAKGESITLVGFGTFAVLDRPEHEARVPGQDKTVTVPARKIVKFKPGAGLKF